MYKRGDVELLKDILESANRIQRYVGSFTLADFMADTQAQDAVPEPTLVAERLETLPPRVYDVGAIRPCSDGVRADGRGRKTK